MGKSAKKLKLSATDAGGPVRTESAVSTPLTGRPPNAPRHLDDVAQSYWRDYSRALIASGMLFEADLKTLEDLCFWEGLKHRGRDELPGGTLYMEYKDEEGNTSHTQPHAAFSNLKAIQGTILQLRSKLGLTVSDRSGLKVAQRSSKMKSIREKAGKNF
jgi:phage terminase small subunit